MGCVCARACTCARDRKQRETWLGLSYSMFYCCSMLGVRVTCGCVHWLMFAGLHQPVCACSGVGSKVKAKGNRGLWSGSVPEPLPSTQQPSPRELGLPCIPASATSLCPSLCETAGVFRYRLLGRPPAASPNTGREKNELGGLLWAELWD